MKKIALVLALISASIPSLTQAKEGEQTIGDFKISYPHKFIYSESLTNKYYGNINKSGKKSAVYEADGVCGYQLAELYVVQEKPPFDSEKMALEINESISPVREGVTSSVELIDISGIKSAIGSLVIEGGEYNVLGNNVQIPDTNRYWSLLFMGKQGSNKDITEFQSCIKKVINTIEIVK